jgi:hypothetical protein
MKARTSPIDNWILFRDPVGRGRIALRTAPLPGSPG